MPNFSFLAGLEVPEKFVVVVVVGNTWVLCLTQRSCFWVALSRVELCYVGFWQFGALNILVPKYFGFQNFLGPIRFWIKISGSQNILGPKNFESKKNFGPKNFYSLQIPSLWPLGTFLVPKNHFYHPTGRKNPMTCKTSWGWAWAHRGWDS